MSDKINVCPFCGGSDVKADNGRCICQNCGANAVKMVWNSRYEEHDNLLFEVRKLRRALVMKDRILYAGPFHTITFLDYQKEYDDIISSEDKIIDEEVEEIIKGAKEFYSESNTEGARFRSWEYCYLAFSRQNLLTISLLYDTVS